MVQQKQEEFTKYERARILGARALQVAMNAPLLIDIKKEKLEEAISDANKMLEICNSVENDMTHESIYILRCLMRNIRE